MARKKLSFEDSMKRLEEIVLHLEKGDIPLQESIAYFEEGTGLLADCSTMLDEAVYAIKSSGGVPVIAHPLSLYISWGKIGPALQDVYNRGVQGLEAWHSGVRVTDALRLEELARKTGFFVTAGSDFHGEAVRADRRLGHTAGGRKIDDRFWEQELQPAL